MNKTMKAMMCMAMFLVLAIGSVGCGENPKEREAKEAFNNTSEGFNEVADLINEHLDAIDEDLVKVCQDMSDVLTECKDLLESGQDITEESYDQIISDLKNIDDWLVDAKAEVEAEISAAGE